MAVSLEMRKMSFPRLDALNTSALANALVPPAAGDAYESAGFLGFCVRIEQTVVRPGQGRDRPGDVAFDVFLTRKRPIDGANPDHPSVAAATGALRSVMEAVSDVMKGIPGWDDPSNLQSGQRDRARRYNNVFLGALAGDMNALLALAYSGGGEARIYHVTIPPAGVPGASLYASAYMAGTPVARVVYEYGPKTSIVMAIPHAAGTATLEQSSSEEED